VTEENTQMEYKYFILNLLWLKQKRQSYQNVLSYSNNSVQYLMKIHVVVIIVVVVVVVAENKRVVPLSSQKTCRFYTSTVSPRYFKMMFSYYAEPDIGYQAY